MDQPTCRDDETRRDGPGPAAPGPDRSSTTAGGAGLAGAAETDPGTGPRPLGITISDREHAPVTVVDIEGPAAVAGRSGPSRDAGAALTIVTGAEEAMDDVGRPGEIPGAKATVADSERPDHDASGRADPRSFDVPTIPNQPGPAGADRPIPVIPGYEVIGELGRGGMGVVYRARQIRLNRLCALKMILAGAHAIPEDAARFLAEARVIARLRHPHIVEIYHVGEAGGLPFFELEFVEGGGLDQRLDGTPWPPVRAAHLIEQLAVAMAEAHRLGIVHRDLKPSNVLLAGDGTPKIVDFGLAKVLEGELGLTRSQSVMGSPNYMAPEQARGATRGAGPAADVYSLGAILYELLTGRPPFRGATVLETLEQVKAVEPVPPSRLVPGLPRDVETICLKCLQKEPAHRYRDAALLAEDLRRCRSGEPIQARPIGGMGRAWRWGRRNPVVAGLASGIALTLVLGIAVATYFAVRATRGERRAREQANEAWAQAQRADWEARRARDEKQLSEHRLYVAELNLAHQAWQEGTTGLAQQYLEASRPRQPGDPDLRGFEWDYLQHLVQSALTLPGGLSAAFSPDGCTLASGRADGLLTLWDTAQARQVTSLRGHTAGAGHLTYSPDGRTLASASDDGTVKLWNTATNQEVRTLRGHTGSVLRVAYHPGGRILASAGSDHTVRTWDPSTGREILVFRGHGAEVYGLAFRPDGRILASAADDGMIRLWDPVTARVLRTLRGHAAAIRWLAFSPDGRTLASASFDRTIKLWNAGTGQVRLTLRHTDRVDGLAYSPDGAILASGGWDHTVRLWDAAAGQPVLTLRGHSALVWGVTFSPDGRRLAAAGADQTIRIWDTSLDQEAMTLRGHTASVHRVTFSPNGRTLASAGADRTIRIWDALTGQELRALHGHADGVSGVTYSPDGQSLASAGGDGTVRIWNRATGKELRALHGHDGPVFSVTYSPDGRTLASASHDQTVRIWDGTTGREVHVLRGHTDGVWAVAASPDGRNLASAGRDGTVRLWDAASAQEILTLRGHVAEVFDLAYSPDGRNLASAGRDGTVRLWDAATGREVQAFHGHASWVSRVAYSPDGRRIASAGRDRSVRIWDVATGQGVLTLHDDAGWLDGVAFAPDGRSLASASFDGTVKIWDATPMSPQLRVGREARGVVEFLAAKALPPAQVLARIRRDPTLSEPVRAQALELAESQGRNLVMREAERRVESLYARSMLRSEVLQSLDTDHSLSQPVRRLALTLASQIPENGWSLNETGWAVVSRPDATASAYLRALRQAEAACRLIPHQAFFLTTLGIAQYRAGDYRAAVASLTRGDRLKASLAAAPFPQDLAFLALSRHRLGQTDEARADLGRLRRAMLTPAWDHNPEALAFLREAEALELDLVFPADPLAP